MADRRTAGPRSYGEAIRSLAPPELTVLLTRRPDLALPPPRDLTELAERALTTASTGQALDDLDRWQLHVLTAVSVLGETGRPAVRALAGGPPAQVDAALDELIARALVWGGRRLQTARAVRTLLGPHPGGLAGPSPDPIPADRVREVLSEIDPAERAVLAELTWRTPVGALARADRLVTLENAQGPVERLLARRLLRPIDSDTVQLRREVAWELREGRLTPEPPPASAPEPAGDLRSVRIVEQSAVGAAAAVVRDLERLLDEVAARSIEVVADGGVSVRSWRALAQALDLDEATVALLLEIADELELVQVERPGLAVARLFDSWLAEPAPQRWLGIVSAWLSMARRPQRPGEEGHPLRHQSDPGAARRRGQLADLIARLPVATPIDATSLAPLVDWRLPRWTRRGEAVADFLDEAHRLGLVAWSAVSPLAAAAVSGQWVADLADRFPAPVDQVIVQSDLSATAPGPLDRSTAFELGELADPAGSGVHRFSAASLRRALAGGWDPAAVRSWLAEHSATGVPQPLEYLIDDVARRHGQVRVRSVRSVVQVDDPAIRAAVLAQPVATRLGLQPLGANLLVSDAEAAEVLAALADLDLSVVAVQTDGSPLQSTRPRPRRASGTRTRWHQPSPDPLLVAERLTQARDLVERGVGSTLDQLGAAYGAGSAIRVDYVDESGLPVSLNGVPVLLSPGAVRLRVPGSTARTVPLSRITGVLLDTDAEE